MERNLLIKPLWKYSIYPNFIFQKNRLYALSYPLLFSVFLKIMLSIP